MFNFLMRCFAQFVMHDSPSLYEWADFTTRHTGYFSEKKNFKHTLDLTFFPLAPFFHLFGQGNASCRQFKNVWHKGIHALWLLVRGLLKLPFYLPCTVVYALIAGLYDLCCAPDHSDSHG